MSRAERVRDRYDKDTFSDRAPGGLGCGFLPGAYLELTEVHVLSYQIGILFRRIQELDAQPRTIRGIGGDSYGGMQTEFSQSGKVKKHGKRLAHLKDKGPPGNVKTGSMAAYVDSRAPEWLPVPEVEPDSDRVLTAARDTRGFAPFYPGN